MHARRRALLKHTVGCAADAFLAAGDADELLGFVVVGRDVGVGDGPIGADAVASVRSEIVIGEAQRDAAIVVGAPADDAGAEPFELRAGSDGVRLAGKLPAAGGCSEVAEGPRRGAEI